MSSSHQPTKVVVQDGDGDGDEDGRATAASAQESVLSLVLQRETALTATPGDNNKPFTKNAWFLNPLLPASPPTHPSPRPPPHPPRVLAAHATRVLFRGWTAPLRRWSDWIDKLRPLYGDVWRRAGVSDAIQASAYKIKKDAPSILGAAAFWDGETSTFCFPWAEATVTLEDALVLGGFSPLGDSVRRPPSEELTEIWVVMVREHRNFNRTSSKKADQSAWMRHFMEGQGDEIEHVAFLALWLSRFVFPSSPAKTVKQHVLPIAIRLSRGERIALAPAVLASLYRDLRLVKEYLVGDGSLKEEPLAIWSPFNLLQLWMWERFPDLMPEKQNLIKDGDPRAARWHDVGRKTDISMVASVLEAPIKFHWRPYALSLENWHKPSFYESTDAELIRRGPGIDEELRSFAQFLRVGELVGLDAIEQYLPHRVAMQFGLAQDVPCCIHRINSKWEEAWETYDATSKTIEFYIPPQCSQPCVTVEYSIWWKQSMPVCAGYKDGTGTEPEVSSSNFVQIQRSEKIENKMKNAEVLQDNKSELQEFYDDMFTKWLDSNENCANTKNDILHVEKMSLPNATTIQELTNYEMEEEGHMEQHFTCESTEKVVQRLEPSEHVTVVNMDGTIAQHNDMKTTLIKTENMEGRDLNLDNEIVMKVEETGTPINEEKENVEVVHRKSNKHGVSGRATLKRSRGPFQPQEMIFNMDQTAQKRFLMKAEESRLRMEIKKLKEEITATEARVMGLEPMSEVLY